MHMTGASLEALAAHPTASAATVQRRFLACYIGCHNESIKVALSGSP